jgi:cyclic pyranopterin phosphate synthase
VTVIDTRDRALRDLRVSVTDRCNFRCTYCMPREVFGPDHAFVPRDELLTFEEITRVVGAFARAGVTRIRLTGGEPLLRRNITHLVELLAGLPGIDDVAMTTNGALLGGLAQPLLEAGLNRVTVSLDAVDPEIFRQMSDTTTDVRVVLDALRTAREVGLTPVKINAVIRRGVNEDQIAALARLGRDEGYTVRFIEYMDVGHSNGWVRDDVVPAAEILERVHAAYPIESVPPARAAETATRHRYLDGAGEIGVIASVTQPFCGACTRARLSPVGELFTCLFGTRGTDLRALVRGGADDAALDDLINGVWARRDDRYSELRTAATPGLPKVEMSYIGG